MFQSAPLAGRQSQSVSRSSRAASVARGSVRYGRAGHAIDSSGMPYERVLCIDAEGRDRTPKPLVAARPHGAGDALPGSWGGSDGLTPGGGGAADSNSDRGSILSFAPLLGSSGLPTARSFLAGSDAAEPSRESSMDGSALPMGRMVGSGGRASIAVRGGAGTTLSEFAAATAAAERQADGGGQTPQLSVAMLEVGRLDQQQHGPRGSPGQQQRQGAHSRQEQGRRQGQRSKGMQCQAAARSSRGIQVLPWELRQAGSANEGESAGGAALHSKHGGAEAEAEGEEAESEDALLALRYPGGPGGGHAGGDWHSERTSPTMSHAGGMLSAAASRRGSMTGGGGGGSYSRRGSMMGGSHASMMHGGDDYSRPDTATTSRRTSIQAGSDWSGRDSMTSSRASFAAALSRLDGRGSVMSSVAGFYPGGSGGRASVMRAGGAGHQAGPALPQPTAAELAAAAARRQKAEQERALAQLPGLVQRLQVAEKAVLVNLQHAKLARYHCVQYCPAEPQQEPADGGAGSTQEAGAPLFLPAGRRRMTRRRPAGPSTAVAAAEVAAEGTLPEGIAAVAAGAAGASEPPTPGAPFSGGPSPMVTSRQPQPELQLLWSRQSELTEELPVSCLAFNRAAPGLLAVGYGRLEYAVSSAGLVAVWSLANPTHPLWHATTACGVSALDWSGRSAGTLAVGFFDGSLALYNVRSGSSSGASAGRGRGSSSSESSSTTKPLARAPPGCAAGGSGGGHAEPVWRLRFVPKAADSGDEMLVSISSDGRLLEWKHAQGLERTELLRLKRQHGSAAARRLQGPAKEAQASAEGYLGRAAGGTCFDFCPADPRTYLVGTEDGGVHRCSTAFTEQYIQSYGGHLAPVYQVCWSPSVPSLFLTASADWSVRLWSEAQPRSLWTFQLPNSKAEVADVAFCPGASTLFAAAAGNTLQLWDVERSVLAPRATATRFGVRLTALAFSRTAPVVVVGADDGVVSVYSLAGMYQVDGEGGEASEQEQRQRLEAALRHHMAQAISD
ncbi:hypothetical protein ABPG75_005737 [Micractinium tetrahymenae]